MTFPTIAIIGAGHGGVCAAAALRTAGHAGRIMLFEREAGWPYERPPLSKAILKGSVTPERILLRKPAFYSDKNIELRAGCTVEAIDRRKGLLHLAQGEAVSYDLLLIATGGEARPFPVAGAGLKGILGLRDLTDAMTIKSAIAAGMRLVVVGGGYIGLEVASFAAMAGVNVSLLERQERVMNRTACAFVSHYFEDLHRSHGVALRLGASVSAFEGDGRVERVVLSDGTMLPADLVVTGIGIRPMERLAAEAGIACDDGVLVDAFGRTSDPAIFAAGDVTRHDNRFAGRMLRLECVQNAASQAEIAARAMLGGSEPYAEVPWFWTEQYGCRLQTAGLWAEGDEQIIRGDPASDRFSILHLRDGRIAAIDTINSLKDFLPGKKLIQERRRVDSSRLGDVSVPLSQIT